MSEEREKLRFYVEQKLVKALRLNLEAIQVLLREAQANDINFSFNVSADSLTISSSRIYK